MSLITILSEQTMLFVQHPILPTMYYGSVQSDAQFVTGETYKVSWDGYIYECVAFDTESGAACIGNAGVMGSTDTGEPFVMMIQGSELAIFTLDTSDTHTISVYQGEGSQSEKIDIIFNNKTYSIDESSLSAAKSALRQHLTTVMNGSGAVINLGGTSYNVDSTKLATATNAFVAYLSTIAGNGTKIVVNGVEYSVDSAKLASAIADLHTAFGGLESGGGGEFTDPALNPTGVTIVDGVYNYGHYTYAVGESELQQLGASSLEDFKANISSLSGGMFESWDDYVASCDMTEDELISMLTTVPIAVSINEDVIDRNQAEYGPILESINNMPINMVSATFARCVNLTTSPAIPCGVLSMAQTFSGCTSLTTSPAIPCGVLSMSETFSGCTSLAKAPAIPSSVTCVIRAFYGCTSLAGEIVVNANPEDYKDCFYGTVKNITITGSCSAATKAALAATSSAGNVTY